MSVKTKLVLSYIAMIFIPIVLSILAGMLIVYVNIRNFETVYNIEAPQKIFLKYPFQLIDDANSKVFAEIKMSTLKESENYIDRNFLETMNTKVNKFNAFIIVRKGKDITYTGNKEKLQNIARELPQFGTYVNDRRGGYFLIKNYSFLIKQQDFYFKDNTQGTVFLIMDANVMFTYMKNVALEFIFVVILILIITNGVLSSKMSKQILVPLKKLKKGADKIKEGELDFNIDIKTKDEFGEAADAFEEMRRKLKESIEIQMKYDENRKELVSNISHDLKTPITAIKGHVEGIMDGVADNPEKMDRYIKTIYVKTCDMNNLIDELFLYSKLDLNKSPFNFEKINIINFLSDIIEELQFDYEKSNIELIFEGAKFNKVIVIGDRDKLKRVITNIIENSSKYMDKEFGKVKVDLVDQGEYVQININDNGSGISSEDLPNIFDRFYRTDSSRNSLKGGSGLGLAISKKIIEQHSGKIWAESQEKFGTKISFILKKCI